MEPQWPTRPSGGQSSERAVVLGGRQRRPSIGCRWAVVSYPTLGRRQLLQGRLGNICLTEQPRLCHSADLAGTLSASAVKVPSPGIMIAPSGVPTDADGSGVAPDNGCLHARRLGAANVLRDRLYPRLRRRPRRRFPRPQYRFVCLRGRLVTGHWDCRVRSRHTLEWNWFRDLAGATERRPHRSTRRCYARSGLGLACCRLAVIPIAMGQSYARPFRKAPEGHPQGSPVVRLSRDHPEGHPRPRGWSMWVVAWVVGLARVSHKCLKSRCYFVSGNGGGAEVRRNREFPVVFQWVIRRTLSIPQPIPRLCWT